MMSKEQPFTPEEFERFNEYCYTVFGLHAIGDIVNDYSVFDGDAIVKQVRQALATIKHLQETEKKLIDKLQDTEKKVEELLLFSNPDGTLTQGFRTEDIIKELQVLSGWEPIVIPKLEIGKTYYVKPEPEVNSIFHRKPVRVIGEEDGRATVELEIKVHKHEAGTRLAFFSSHLSPNPIVD